MKPIAARHDAGRRVATVFAGMTLLAAGPIACGTSGPDMASVSGRVTYEGKPVPKGTITFVTRDQGGRNAVGQIQPDGVYSLQTETPGDGALVGEYNVVIAARDEQVLDYMPKVPVKPKFLIPEKYEDPKKSELSRSVQPGSNRFDFDLK